MSREKPTQEMNFQMKFCENWGSTNGHLEYSGFKVAFFALNCLKAAERL